MKSFSCQRKGMEGKRARVPFNLGVILCLVGIAGILAPKVTSLAISLIIAIMLILAGVVLGIFYYFSGKRDKMSWTKALSPLVFGIFLAFKPFALVIVIGLSIFFYFIMNALASVTLAYEMKPAPGWELLFFIGITSLCLAGAFILFWPYSTYWYVGLMVGATLILEGVFLILVS